MKTIYPLVVRACEKALEGYLPTICTDPENLYRGTLDNQFNWLMEPGTGSGLSGRCCTLYSCKESKYYRDPALLTYVENACDMILRTAHPDGTNDFLATNYYTPATFELIEFCRGYKNFVSYMEGTEREIAVQGKMKQAIGHWANGCLNGGFHTPNHRWVHTSALCYAYNTLKVRDQRFMDLAEKYLAEKAQGTAD